MKTSKKLLLALLLVVAGSSVSLDAVLLRSGLEYPQAEAAQAQTGRFAGIRAGALDAVRAIPAAAWNRIPAVRMPNFNMPKIGIPQFARNAYNAVAEKTTVKRVIVGFLALHVVRAFIASITGGY